MKTPHEIVDLLYHVEKLIHSQDGLIGGVLVADVSDPLALVVLSQPDANGALFISVELCNLLGSLQLPDLKEKFTPLFSQHRLCSRKRSQSHL